MKRKLFAAVTAVAMALSTVPCAFAEQINETYDDIKYTNSCDTEISGLTLCDDAPDGSKYYTLAADAESVYQLNCLDSSTSEDYMWQMDMRFDEAGSGFTVRDKSRKKTDTCVRRNDVTSDGVTTSYIAIRKGNNSGDITNYVEIDTTKWYRIQLIGQYGTSKELIMQVFEWSGGEWEQKGGDYTGINKRNNASAGAIDIVQGSSFDNVTVTKLGADTLTLSTVPEDVTEINAGSSVQMQLAAQRNGRDINAPAYEWKVYENGAEITDGSAAIDSDGALTAAKACGDKNVTVKAISTEKGNVEGSYDITIKAVSFDDEKYDTLSLSAENDYVRANEPLALTVTATKDGAAVDLEDGDVVWAFYDEDNVQETGNKYITVEDNKLCVSDKVISQNITLRAQNANKTVSASLPVRIKASDANESDEGSTRDKILAADACEDVSNEYITSGSWDGSHYYSITSTTDMTSVDATTEDIIIETDLKFIEENSGIKLRDSGNNKEGGQISRQGTSIGRVGSSNKFTAYCTGDADSWYHVMIVARCGADGSYGKAYLYKYDDDGNMVNPDTGVSDSAVSFDLDLRTMASKSFTHIQPQSGTGIDNMRIMRLVPDELNVSLGADSVFAGNTVQASVSVLHKGSTISAFPESRVKWVVYDSDNAYPVDDDTAKLISVDSAGLVTVDATVSEQTVYIRAVSVDNSDVYDAEPLSIKSSDIFAIIGIGVNEAGTKVTEMKVQKDYYYNGDVTFVAAVYNDNGELVGISVKSLLDNTLSLGENKISLDLSLPDEFEAVETYVWTSM